MRTNQVQIYYDSWTVPPLRIYDRYLMEDFNDQNFQRNQLERLNACRMYLQVTTLAEITDHTGTELLPQVLVQRSHGYPKGLGNISSSTLQWPHMHCPSPACWRFWTTTICSIYTGSAKGMRLHQPLGPWLKTYDTTRFWHWRLLDENHLMYRHTPLTATRVALQTLRRRTMTKFSPTVPTTLPFEGPPITPSDTTLGHVKLPIPPLPAHDPAPPPPTLHQQTLQRQFRHHLEPWQHVLYGSLRKAYSTNTLHQALNANKPLMIVSDASVQNNGQSGFAWVIAHNATPMWRGMGLAPGPDTDMYSGRAEAFGLYAAILFFQYYLSCYDTRPHHATMSCFCDNLGLITNLNNLNATPTVRPNATTSDDRDIYLAIKDAATNCSPVKLTYWHVKGHQDNNPQHPLTIEEQHNVDCDKLAKNFVSTHPLRSTLLPTPEFTLAAPHLKIQGRLICRRVLLELRHAAAIPDYWDYLQQRFTWNHADLTTIQWETLKTSLNSFPRNDQCRIVLFMHGKLALRTSKFHPHLGSNLCPSCQRHPEDARHFLECQHVERRRLFSSLKTKLTEITMKYSLHPAILTTFWLGLLAIRHNTPYQAIQLELPPILRSTVTAQARLGWEQLYQGRVSNLWEQAIDHLNQHLPISGRYIVTQMIKTVWTYVLALWTTRNQHLHQDAGRLSIPDYRQAVITMYETHQQLPPEVQEAVFHRPLEELLDKPPAFLRSWIERSQRYIQQQLKAAKKRTQLRTHDIRSFFRRQDPPANDLNPP